MLLRTLGIIEQKNNFNFLSGRVKFDGVWSVFYTPPYTLNLWYLGRGLCRFSGTGKWRKYWKLWIASGLKSGNACCHSVQNVLSSDYKNLSSSLLSKNMKIKIYRSGILSFVLYGCETWSFTSKEEHWLRVIENTVLRKKSGPKKD